VIRGKGKLIFSLVMLIIFVGMLIMSMGYSQKARFVPLVVSIPGVIVSAVQVFIELRSFFKKRLKDEAVQEIAATVDTKKRKLPDAQVARSEKIIIGWILFLLGLIFIFGFWVAIPVFLLLFFRIYGKESWTFTIVSTACSWGVIFLIFQVLLKVPIYGGLLEIGFA